MEKSHKRMLFIGLGCGCLVMAALVLIPIGIGGYSVLRAHRAYEQAINDPEYQRRMAEKEAMRRRRAEIVDDEKLLSSAEARRVYEESEFNYFESRTEVVTLPLFARLGEKLPWREEGATVETRYLVKYPYALNGPNVETRREALDRLIEDEESLLQMVRDAILKDYRQFSSDVSGAISPMIRLSAALGGEDVSDEELNELFPDLEKPEDVDPYIHLGQVYVYRPDSEGKVSVGLGFNVSWTVDPVGVVIRDGEVTGVGLDVIYEEMHRIKREKAGGSAEEGESPGPSESDDGAAGDATE